MQQLPVTQDPGSAINTLRLSHMKNGDRCRIHKHHAHGAIRQRLLDLGFMPNSTVEVIRCALLGDPLQIKVGDYSVAIRRQEANLIEIQPVEA